MTQATCDEAIADRAELRRLFGEAAEAAVAVVPGFLTLVERVRTAELALSGHLTRFPIDECEPLREDVGESLVDEIVCHISELLDKALGGAPPTGR